MFKKSGTSPGVSPFGLNEYYDLTGQQIGWSHGDYTSVQTEEIPYGDHSETKITQEYHSHCTYYDNNKNIIGYSDGSENSRKYYDSNNILIGSSESQIPPTVDFFDTQGNKTGQCIGNYPKTYFGIVPFLNKMLSISREIQEKATLLVNTILISNNETEATKKINDLLKNSFYQPATINTYILNTTPLLATIDKGYLISAELLLKSGANPNQQTNEEGFTPLTKVTNENNTGFIKLLVKSGANLELNDLKGLNPLTTAVSKNFMDSTSLLLELGAKISIKDNLGNNPLSYARKNANKNMLEFLRSKGARRCWLHEFLGKGDELTGFEKNDKSLTKKMWVGVADKHSLLGGIVAIFATPFTGLFDACNQAYKGIKDLFCSHEKTLIPKTFHHSKTRKNSIQFKINKAEYASSKNQNKELLVKKNIERTHSPGQRPSGYAIQNYKSALVPKKLEKEMAS